MDCIETGVAQPAYLTPKEKPLSLMKELIKIGNTKIGDGTVKTVNARDLQKFLGIEQDHTSWIKAQIKRAKLVENRDYVLLTDFSEQTGRGGSNKTEYFLTVDAAKHIAMLCSKEKGFEVREYLMDCEKIAVSQQAHRLRKDKPLSLIKQRI